jgi:hypothetical protein
MMFKRARWIGAGAALGAGAVLWAQRKLRGAADRYGPVGLAGEAVDRAISLPGNIRDAFSEGRQAMREREAELRRNHLRPTRRHGHR